jgi:hypothetical protein
MTLDLNQKHKYSKNPTLSTKVRVKDAGIDSKLEEREQYNKMDKYPPCKFLKRARNKVKPKLKTATI